MSRVVLDTMRSLLSKNISGNYYDTEQSGELAEKSVQHIEWFLISCRGKDLIKVINSAQNELQSFILKNMF